MEDRLHSVCHSELESYRDSEQKRERWVKRARGKESEKGKERKTEIVRDINRDRGSGKYLERNRDRERERERERERKREREEGRRWVELVMSWVTRRGESLAEISMNRMSESVNQRRGGKRVIKAVRE